MRYSTNCSWCSSLACSVDRRIKQKTTDATSMRICRFLGDISFPLYIVHYPLMYAFYMWLIKSHLYTFSQTWPIALAVVASSILVAWLALKLYDEPVRKWLRKYA